MLKWNGKVVSQQAKDAAVKGLQDAGDVILDGSNQIAPIDEGTLIRSGNVTVDIQKLEVAISYDTPYAIKMHEAPYKHKNGRESHFLLKSLQKNEKEVLNYVGEKIRKAFDEG